MKQLFFIIIFLTTLLLTGCASDKEISTVPSSNIAENAARMWTDSQSARKTEIVPYTEEFAKEISETATEFYMPLMKDCEEHGQNPEGAPQVDIKIGGRDNHLYTGTLETYPCLDGNFFVVKPYGHVQELNVSYFEIYFFDGNGSTMIGICPYVSYTSLYCDGEFFYYIFKDTLCRISEDGTVDEIIDFEVYNPENPDDEIYPSVMDVGAEAEGDTLKVTAGFYSGVGTAYYNKTNTYIINVADLSVEPHIGEFNVRKKPYSETSESANDVFPPEGIIANTIEIPSEHQYETGEEIPAGNHVTRFELDGVKCCDAVQYGSFAFVIEDDGNIVAEGEPEHEDNEVVKALREIYSLEYVGISHLNEHLFRYGDGLLAIAKSPAEKNQSVYFKDYDYDESQFYYALVYEPYDN